MKGTRIVNITFDNKTQYKIAGKLMEACLAHNKAAKRVREINANITEYVHGTLHLAEDSRRVTNIIRSQWLDAAEIAGLDVTTRVTILENPDEVVLLAPVVTA